jgi:hypothetical protein
MRVIDIAKIIAPECEIKTIGIRPGEKLHEILVTEEYGRNTFELNGMYIIMPARTWWKQRKYQNGTKVPEGFIYSSNNNDNWVDAEQLMEMINSNHDLEPYTAKLADSIWTSVDSRDGAPRSPGHSEIGLDHSRSPGRRV